MDNNKTQPLTLSCWGHLHHYHNIPQVAQLLLLELQTSVPEDYAAAALYACTLNVQPSCVGYQFIHGEMDNMNMLLIFDHSKLHIRS